MVPFHEKPPLGHTTIASGQGSSEIFHIPKNKWLADSSIKKETTQVLQKSNCLNNMQRTKRCNIPSSLLPWRWRWIPWVSWRGCSDAAAMPAPEATRRRSPTAKSKASPAKSNTRPQEAQAQKEQEIGLTNCRAVRPTYSSAGHEFLRQWKRLPLTIPSHPQCHHAPDPTPADRRHDPRTNPLPRRAAIMRADPIPQRRPSSSSRPPPIRCRPLLPSPPHLSIDSTKPDQNQTEAGSLSRRGLSSLHPPARAAAGGSCSTRRREDREEVSGGGGWTPKRSEAKRGEAKPREEEGRGWRKGRWLRLRRWRSARAAVCRQNAGKARTRVGEEEIKRACAIYCVAVPISGESVRCPCFVVRW